MHQSVDVCVDGKRRHTKGLAHHHSCGFVSDAWQGFEVVEVLGDVAAVLFDEDAAEFRDGRAFSRGQAAWADDLTDVFDRLPHHVPRVVGQLEEGRGHCVHPSVGALRRQQHGHKKGVGIDVVQRHGRFWVEPFQLVHCPLHALCFGLQLSHGSRLWPWPHFPKPTWAAPSSTFRVGPRIRHRP